MTHEPALATLAGAVLADLDEVLASARSRRDDATVASLETRARIVRDALEASDSAWLREELYHTTNLITDTEETYNDNA